MDRSHDYQGDTFVSIFARIILFIASCFSDSAIAINIDRIELPEGFSIAIYADNVANARQLARSENGTIFVGTRRAGKVYAVVDADKDNRAEKIHLIANDLFMPSGVAYLDGTLYVAEVDRILAFDNIDQQLNSSPNPRVVFEELPKDSHHGWKYIRFGPDDHLYFAIGAPCNVCQIDDPYGAISRLNILTGTSSVVARGIRNTVGFAWHPRSHELWFTDNGRDMLGDDSPPGELNRITSRGQHFGFPFIHGRKTIDPDFGDGVKVDEFVQPELELGAHVAPLGPLFITAKQFPSEYEGNLLVAEHGSWNRSKKSGYRIMRASFDDDGRVASYEPFARGWLVGQAHWGRPVAMLELPDGSILVSDDYAGAIYRITYQSQNRLAP